MRGRWNKKLDVWTIENAGTRYSVTVRGVKDGRGEPIRSFEAECSDLDVRVEESDLVKLRTAIEKAINAAKRIEWERFLVVEIGGETEHVDWLGRPQQERTGDEAVHEDFADSVNSVFKYETVEFGRSSDGQEVHRELNVGGNSGTCSGGREQYLKRRPCWGDGERQHAALPWTPERLAALQRIKAGYVDLNRELFRLLHPERLADTLAGLDSMGVRLIEAGTARAAGEPAA